MFYTILLAGHADFSGEVDRFLTLADGFLLVVDAAEGPKSQTKYVLSRALASNLQPLVFFNKCDRPDAMQKIDSGETEERLEQLFRTLTPSGQEPPDYVTLYGSARAGWVTEDPLNVLEWAGDDSSGSAVDTTEHGMHLLLDQIVEHIPPPRCGRDDDPFSMAAVTVGNDPYLGRLCMGRIIGGSVAVNDAVSVFARDDSAVGGTTTNVAGVYSYAGLTREELTSARAGDVVTVAGVPLSMAVGDTLTLTNNSVEQALVTPPLAQATLSMDFGANDGPLAGKEGTHVASSKIRARLVAETDNNVTLQVEPSPLDSEKTVVYARGELQLGVLIEQMRREGFEMIISPPRVLTKKCPDTGVTLEPFEEVTIDVDSEYSGAVISSLTGDRKGVVLEMRENNADGKTQLVLEVPSRGLLGFSSEIATATKGSAVVNHLYVGDREFQNLGAGLTKGKLVSNESGKATAYALGNLASRGTLFIQPGDAIYSGMVIGENAKPGDLEVNAIRAKEKTNIRTQNKDEAIKIPPPKIMSVEAMIGYMESDEVIEVTPKNIRLRKTILNGNERERAARTKNKQLRAQR